MQNAYDAAYGSYREFRNMDDSAKGSTMDIKVSPQPGGYQKLHEVSSGQVTDSGFDLNTNDNSKMIRSSYNMNLNTVNHMSNRVYQMNKTGLGMPNFHLTNQDSNY